MLPSFLLSLREGLEAALIIGIVIGALHKIHRPEWIKIIWIGSICAASLSLVAALVLNRLGASLEGKGEEIFEGATMFLAAIVLTWMIFWMRRQARSMQSELESGVRRAALQGSMAALFSLAFTAILREGIELALFLTATSMASDSLQVLSGAFLGLGVSAFLGWALFASLIKLDLRRFFQVTGVLLILFAAGLVAHGVHEFNEASLIPAGIEHVWDINFLLNEKSTLGMVVAALFGYNGNPSLTEVLAYLTYFVLIAIGLRKLAITAFPATQKA